MIPVRYHKLNLIIFLRINDFEKIGIKREKPLPRKQNVRPP